MSGIRARLPRDELMQHAEHLAERRLGERPEPLRQPFAIDGADLVQDNKPLFRGEPAGDAEGVGVPVGGGKGPKKTLNRRTRGPVGSDGKTLVLVHPTVKAAPNRSPLFAGNAVDPPGTTDHEKC